MDTLAKRIAMTRKELGLRQADLAEAADVSEQAVSAWELGLVTDIKLTHLFALSDLFKCNPRWLALGKGPRFMRAAILALFAVVPLFGLFDRLSCVLCKIVLIGRKAKSHCTRWLNVCVNAPPDGPCKLPVNIPAFS